MKVQAESFHLNGHIIGFRLQTQKLDSPYKTPSNTLAVKGLNIQETLGPVQSIGMNSGKRTNGFRNCSLLRQR